KGLMTILFPLAWMCQFITKKMKHEKNKSVLRRADLMSLTLSSKDDGALSHSETNVIQNVLNLPALAIYDIMTPRSVLYSVSEDDTLQEVFTSERFRQFSRIPVFASNKEEVVGMVLKSDIL